MRPAQNGQPWTENIVSFTARCIVHLWPVKTRDWAVGFASELHEISSAPERLRWIAGGIMLLIRERFRAFIASFGRPFGVPSVGPMVELSRASSRLPRLPRIITVLLLAASCAILLHPEARTSLSALYSPAKRGSWNPDAWSSVQKLKKQAAITNDPKLFGLLALLPQNDEERTRLQNRAISADPSLTWLEYEDTRLNLGRIDTNDGFILEKAARLQRWNPDNAAFRLIPAEVLFNHLLHGGFPGSVGGKPGHTLSPFEQRAAGNTAWLAAMDYAFSAPAYAAYTEEEFELVRHAAQVYGVSDPDISVQALMAQRISDLANLRTYSNIVLFRATHDGKKDGIAQTMRVLHFAQTLHQQSLTTLDEYVSAQIGRDACIALQPLLQTEGRLNEAALITSELGGWNAAMQRVASSKYPSGRLMYRQQFALEAWSGVTIYVAACLTALMAIITLVAFLVLWSANDSASGWRLRLLRPSSAALDFAPLLLFAASAILFLAYHPYAQIYQNAVNMSQLRSVDDVEVLLSAGLVTHTLSNSFARTSPYFTDAYHVWLWTTAALALVAAFLLSRIARRRRPA